VSSDVPYVFLAFSFGLIFCFSLACGPLAAQVNTGRILGAVTDQTGGVIVGATVTVTKTGISVARTLTTDQAGAYAAPDLIPGTYSVRVTAMGFKTFQQANITVGVGQATRVDAHLTPGQVTQTVEVTAAAPMLDATSAVVSSTLNTQTIVDLPLISRNFEDLLTFRPGVATQPGGGSLTVSVNGIDPSDNNNYVEGLDNNEPFSGDSLTNQALSFGDAATFLPIDAIQEVNIEDNAPAEFGRKPGAVINIGIKSGTNTIHGSAYAFGRDGAWDATDFVSPPITAQPVQLEQWGGTIGGPIIKDKLFYFGAFERQSYSVGNAFALNTPTTSPASGDPGQSIPVAEAALAAAGVPLSPLSLKLLPLFGVTNNPTSAATIGFPDVFSSNNAVGKVDYHPNDHHTISGSYFFGDGSAVGEDQGYTEQIFEGNNTLRSEFLVTSWTWTPNSNWVNDLRVGWNHTNQLSRVGDYQTPSSAYGLNTGITNPLALGFPSINVGSFAPPGGNASLPRFFGPANDYDLVDHVSWLHGKHAFTFGAEILHFVAPLYKSSHSRGVFKFDGGSSLVNSPIPNMTALEAFLAGLPNTANGATVFEGNSAGTYTDSNFSGFFEDSWRATEKLTVTMGLRYEYYTPLSEINNRIGSWSPTVGFEQQGVNINHPYNGDPKDFSPRLGIAYDISGNGTTVIRAGAGLYYDNLITQSLVAGNGLPGGQVGIAAIPTAFTTYMPDGAAVAPLKATGGMGGSTISLTAADLNWTLAGPVLPPSSTSGLACGNGLAPVNPVPGAPTVNPSPCSILAVSPNLPSPRTTSWNLGIQHALTPTLAMEVDYIGNHSSRLPAVTELNQINPNSPAEIACGYCDQITDLPYYSQYPYLQYIDIMSDTDYSNYNSLQATLTARSFHNLSFIASYTYSHALTDEPGLGFSHILPQNPSAPQLDYGPFNYDIRHHFSFTLTYAIPGKKSPLQLLQGWSVQSAVTLQSGMPWGPVDSRNVSGTGLGSDRWDFFGNPNDFNVGPNPIPFYGDVTAMPAMCLQEAAAIGTTTTSLPAYGCYAVGNSVMIAPPPGQFGTMARNLFYGPSFDDWDLSIFKNWTFKERLTAQFRAEFFNILNHPIYANPSVIGNTDPSASAVFGCACETPDQASTNPVLGTGGARAIQLGLKLLF
jgi:Carboxypeptidase regulatory-like domain